MSHNYFFLSYSRSQLYFTESLVLNLEKTWVHVWFDLQRLEPGTSWQAGIDSGLQNCAGLILVASQASLASRYVRKEWETVLSAGKPVYVVWYEPVQLPPELTTAGSVDLSVDFDAGFQRLLDCISGRVSCFNSPPPLNRFNYPARLPEAVHKLVHFLSIHIGLMLALFLIAILITPIDTSFLRTLVMGVVPFSVGIAALLIWRWRLITHQIYYNRLVQIFMFLPFCWIANTCTYVLTIANPASKFGQTGSEALTVVVFLLIYGTFPLAAWAFFKRRSIRNLYIDSLSVYRWLPKGAFSARQRRNLHQRKTLNVNPVSYQVYHEHEGVARRLDKAMQRAGHSRVDENGDWNILIITNETKPELVDELLTAHVPLIPILASNVNLNEQLPKLKDYQMIDYRRRDFTLLEALAFYLGQREFGRSLIALSVTPEVLEQSIFPTPGIILERYLGVGKVQARLILMAIVCAILLGVAFLAYEMPRTRFVPTPIPIMSIEEMSRLLAPVVYGTQPFRFDDGLVITPYSFPKSASQQQTRSAGTRNLVATLSALSTPQASATDNDMS